MTCVAEYYTVPRCCALLDCSRPTVLRMLARGDISGTRLGREYRIDAQSLADYLAGRRVDYVPGCPRPNPKAFKPDMRAAALLSTPKDPPSAGTRQKDAESLEWGIYD